MLFRSQRRERPYVKPVYLSVCLSTILLKSKFPLNMIWRRFKPYFRPLIVCRRRKLGLQTGRKSPFANRFSSNNSRKQKVSNAREGTYFWPVVYLSLRCRFSSKTHEGCSMKIVLEMGSEGCCRTSLWTGTHYLFPAATVVSLFQKSLTVLLFKTGLFCLRWSEFTGLYFFTLGSFKKRLNKEDIFLASHIFMVGRPVNQVMTGSVAAVFLENTHNSHLQKQCNSKKIYWHLTQQKDHLTTFLHIIFKQVHHRYHFVIPCNQEEFI